MSMVSPSTRHGWFIRRTSRTGGKKSRMELRVKKLNNIRMTAANLPWSTDPIRRTRNEIPRSHGKIQNKTKLTKQPTVQCVRQTAGLCELNTKSERLTAGHRCRPQTYCTALHYRLWRCESTVDRFKTAELSPSPRG